MATNFTVIEDADYGFIVADASVNARSFALVPADRQFAFETRADAEREARFFSGKSIPLRMIETPERFEAIADTLYGPAWD